QDCRVHQIAPLEGETLVKVAIPPAVGGAVEGVPGPIVRRLVLGEPAPPFGVEVVGGYDTRSLCQVPVCVLLGGLQRQQALGLREHGKYPSAAATGEQPQLPVSWAAAARPDTFCAAASTGRKTPLADRLPKEQQHRLRVGAAQPLCFIHPPPSA